MRENSANCKLFPFIHCFAYNSKQTITMGIEKHCHNNHSSDDSVAFSRFA